MNQRDLAAAARNKRRRYIRIAGGGADAYGFFHAIGAHIEGGDIATVCRMRTSVFGQAEAVIGDYLPHPFCMHCERDLDMALDA